MTESLEVIYKGHATVIKNKQYLTPEEYIQPFVERLAPYTDKFICQVKPAEQLTVDGEIKMIYNKVLVMGIFPEEYDVVCKKFKNDYHFHRIVAMAYGLDCRVPYCKFYTGVVDDEMNFYAFGGDCINLQKITEDSAIDYEQVDVIVKNGLSDNCPEMLQQFDEMFTSETVMKQHLGDWIDFTLRKEYINDSGKVKLSSTMAVNAYKDLMLDKDCDYYSDEPEKSMHLIYSAWANQIVHDEKDLTNRYEKTQLLNQLLKL